MFVQKLCSHNKRWLKDITSKLVNHAFPSSISTFNTKTHHSLCIFYLTFLISLPHKSHCSSSCSLTMLPIVPSSTSCALLHCDNGMQLLNLFSFYNNNNKMHNAFMCLTNRKKRLERNVGEEVKEKP